MSIFDKYPDTDFENFNLDWIIRKIKEITKEVSDFVVINRIVWGGLHDPGKEYPRWCIVDTPTHEGYISIKPVPAGITIDNEDYWRQVANYSALYADFQNRIVTLESAVSDLQTEVEHIKDRHYVLIADSYGDHDIGGVHYSWTEYVINHLGLDAVNISKPNAGFVHNPLAGTFQHWLEEYVNNGAIDNPEEITDIIVCAGANDMGGIVLSTVTKSQIITAVANFCAYCKTTFPNAKVGIGMIGATLGNCGPYYTAFYDTVEAYKSVIDNDGYYIENSECILMERSLTSGDGVHPTVTGYDFLNKHMISAVRDGRVNVTVGNTVLLSTPFTSALGSWNIAPTSYTNQHNGNVRLVINQLGAAFTFTADKTFDDLTGLTVYNTFIKLLPFIYSSNGSLMCSDLANGKATMLGKVSASLTTTTSDILHLELPIYAAGDGLYIGLPASNAFIDQFGAVLKNTDGSQYTYKPYILAIAPSTLSIDQSVNNEL